MYELFQWIWEHRNQPLTWATVMSFMWLVLDKFGRKLITNQLKRLFHVKNKSDFAAYVENQKRIESKVDMLLDERGLSWDAEKSILSVDGEKSTLKSPWAVTSRAGIAGAFTRRMNMLLKSREKLFKLRGNHEMMKKFTSRKFLMAVISAALVIANDGLDLGLDQNTIIAFGSIVVGWIIGESAIDAKRAGGNDASYTSSKDAGDV